VKLSFDLQPGDGRLFTDESLELIELMEQGLLRLEHELDPGAVNDVFRAAHTLKGSAATIGHRRMAELTHAMEDLFGAFRSGTLHEVKPFADLLLSAVDVLRALVDEVQAGKTLTDAPEALTGQLREMLAAATRPAGETAEIAASTPAAGGPDAPAAQEGDAEAAGAALAPLIRRLLVEAPAGYEARSLIVCGVDPLTEWQAVRLLQLVLETEETGRLIASAPSREEIEGGLSSTLLAMLVRGGPDELSSLRSRLAALDDVDGVEVVAAPLGGAPASAAETASVDVYDDAYEHRRLGAARTDDAASAGAPDSAERRQADLGAETRGLAAADRMTIAGDRLKAAQQTIRIDVDRLDELMNLVGELVVHKTRLAQSAQLLVARLGDDPAARRADEDARQLARIASQLQDQVTGLRMLPIEAVFGRFPRVVRDMAASLGKDVQLVIEGKETELDRSVLEVVGDPLGHLVRNALDHGVESVEERSALGKPLPATLRLTARHAEGRILITVEDDGRGMDPAMLRRVAVEKGLLTRQAAEAASDAEMLEAVFRPGFSTAGEVTEVSGRGVGLDVVRNNIEHLDGRVDLVSVPGQGTKVSLSLPLTLAIIGALLVRSGARVCAVPLSGVAETLRVEPGAISRSHGSHKLKLRGRAITVEQLDAVLGDPPRPLEANERGFFNLVVIRSREEEMALAVDAFVGQHEVVIKSLGGITGPRKGLAGATVLADGTVGLVVDVAALLEDRAATAASGPGRASGTRTRASRVA
jgi:two-component system chemotaxis sensor kinase CheA